MSLISGLFFKKSFMSLKFYPGVTLIMYIFDFLCTLLQVAPPFHTQQLQPTTHHPNSPDYRWNQVRSSTLFPWSTFQSRPWKPVFFPPQSASCRELLLKLKLFWFFYLIDFCICFCGFLFLFYFAGFADNYEMSCVFVQKSGFSKILNQNLKK